MLTMMRTIFLLAILCVGTPAHGSERVTVRATTLSDAAIDYIARQSEAIRGEVRANELPERMIQRVCGNYTNAYGVAFFELNQSLVREPARRARPVLMPACVKWRRDVDGKGIPVRVIASETLDSLLMRVIGRSGAVLFQCGLSEAQSSRCGQPYKELIRRLNPEKNLDDLKEGEVVNVPLVTTPTTFTLKTGISALDAVKAILDLGKFGQPESGLISVVDAPEIWLVRPPDVEAADDVCWNAQKNVKAKWPYDAALLASVVRRTLQLSGPGSRIVLSIIDSGVADEFPVDFLQKNSGEPVNAYGKGVYIANQTTPFDNHLPIAEKIHGTQVAFIAIGGSGLAEHLPELKSMLRVSVVKVFKPTGTTGAYRIDSGALSDGVEFALTNSHIGNISISSSKELPTVRELLGKYPHKLFVVAAGNEKRDLGTVGFYPAGYGGLHPTTSSQVITVAAHDATLTIAKFSNQSSRYVDILAPGCDVPYRNDRGGVHGTSFAAPLVSLASALLMSTGLGVFSAKEVKDRLTASGDYDQRLSKVALSSSRLNIVKALSLFDDVLETKKSGQLIFGDWLADSDFQICSDENVSPEKDRIRKITRVGLSKKIRMVVLDALKNQQVTECDANGDGIDFRSLDGTTMTVEWGDLIDLVPARWPKSN